MKKALVWIAMPFVFLGMLLGCASSPTNIALRLDANNGEDVETLYLSNLDQVTTPASPVRVGYRFDGWFWDNETFMVPFAEASLSDHFEAGVGTLYAKWSRLVFVSFEANGGTDVATLNDVSGTPIVLPDSLKSGYVLVGWYLDEALTIPCDWQTIPSEDTMLYAKWEALHYLLTFHSGLGSVVQPITAALGAPLIEPEAPTLLGYTFEGWYADPQYTVLYAFTTMPESNLTLYAKWSPITYGIDYECNGGTNHPDNPGTYSVETEEVGLLPASKLGYRFAGWYTNADLTGEYLDQLPVSSPQILHLYAKWELNPPVLANGTFNLSNASPLVRHIFVATAERYLLQGMVGGIPLYNTGTLYVFSTRLSLPMPVWLPNIGFGERFAAMKEDDTAVIMANGLPGNSGEYTYRYAVDSQPYLLHPWIATGDIEIDVNSWLQDNLYRFEPNATLDGYAVNASMAVGDPQPVITEGAEPVSSGASVWRVTIRDHLSWQYHPLTDLSELPQGHEVLDTTDFIDTFRLALDKQWTHAVSGSESLAGKILNAWAYLEGTSSWEDVGIKQIDSITLEFYFTGTLTLWEVKTWLANPFMTPIHTDLYSVLESKNDVAIEYGILPEMTAYSGPYTFAPDSLWNHLKLMKNPLFHSPERSAFTHISIQFIEENNDRFAAFQAGKLDQLQLITPHANLLADHPQLLVAPQLASVRLLLNALGTVTQQRELFPSGSWVPEPILANAAFRQAMYYAIDRVALNEGIYAAALPLTTYLSTAFFYDTEFGIPYRLTPQGMAVQGEWSPATFGMDRDLATLLFAQALNEMIAKGTLTRGTLANPTFIDLNLVVPQGYSVNVQQGEQIKATLEALFQSTTEHVYVRVVLTELRYPDLFLNALMYGEFDMAIGSSIVPTSSLGESLAIYCSDNRTGVTLNWGYDTSIPEIRVTYETEPGVVHDEIWSFDAIVSALSGEVLVVDGKAIPQ
jgi:uncharacterized repeat protein (TIGR02543 family)